MFGTFAPEGAPACSGARESVVYGCALPLPTSSALQVPASQSCHIILCCAQHAAFCTDSARAFRATIRPKLVVWRMALPVNRTWIPSTSALSTPAPPPPCGRRVFSPPARPPAHAHDPCCSNWCHRSQHCVACRRLCSVVFHASLSLCRALLLLLYAQHRSRRSAAVRPCLSPPRAALKSRRLCRPLSISSQRLGWQPGQWCCSLVQRSVLVRALVCVFSAAAAGANNCRRGATAVCCCCCVSSAVWRRLSCVYCHVN